MEQIQYTGLKNLENSEKIILDRLSADYYSKIQRAIKNENTSITIHIKVYKKAGSRKKFSINTKAVAPTKIFESKQSNDWNFQTALHGSLDSLYKEIHSKLRTNTHYKKRYE